MSRRATFAIASCLISVAACGNDGGRHVRPPSESSARDGGMAIETPLPTRPLPLVPRPRSMTRASGELVIDHTTRIAVDEETRAAGEQLARWLGLSSDSLVVLGSRAPDPVTGIVVRKAGDDAGRPARDAAVDPPRAPDEEAYSLDVSPKRAVVRARTSAGIFYGAQTLAQLAGARRIGIETAKLDTTGRWSIPCVAIEDAPRFPFRAMHLDVARHFFSKELVERWIDLLSFYRFNVFHWHLTDDQGFRIEVKGHPELTTIGGRDGFYTQEHAREVVRHARDRFVTVVPEIEMPGHARAILAAHPELSCTGKKQEVPRTWGVFEDVLCAGNEKTYELLGDVLGEIVEVFPSRLVHLGGDEVEPTRWSACAKCRAAMKAAHVKSPSDLEGLFMRRASSMLARLGRRPLVWDEALSDVLPSDAVILAWQSKERGREAANHAHDVVMAPHDHAYFNIRQSRTGGGEVGHEGFLPWTKVHAFDPIPAGLEPTATAKVLGGEGALWTEYVESSEQIDTMAMPRMAALADALWSGSSSSNGEQDFAARFEAQLPALDASAVHYFIEPPTGLPARRVFVDGDVVSLTILPPRLFPGGVVRWTRDGGSPTASSEALDSPIEVRDTTVVAAAVFLTNGRSSAVVKSEIVKEQPRAASSVTTPAKGALYTYIEGDFHRLPDLTKISVKARGRVPAIGLAQLERALGGRMRKERFAAVFEGFVEAPADGVYRFVARADDGVRIELDGEKILEDDGEHEPRESDGEIALRQGHHRVRVSYFQGSEGKELDVKMTPPGGAPAPLDVVVDVGTPSPAR